MNETHTFKSVAIKTLAIIGFIVTLVLIVFLGVKGLSKLPGAFSSLASIVESIQNYRPVEEITLTPEKTVVNSGEQFQITWTDVQEDGEYTFSYECTDGITLQVRRDNNEMVTINCTDELTVDSTVLGLFLSITSGEMRFVEVPLYLSFINADADLALDTEAKVAVVNAQIPTEEEEEKPVPPKEETPKPTTPKPATPRPTPVPQPVYTIVYPESNPNGFVDLKVTILGTGILDGNTFINTGAFDEDKRNALRFDIKNVGTKTSGEWTFKTILPGGEVYESKDQRPLKPSERVEFTLGFTAEQDDDDELVRLTTTVDARGDNNSSNDRAVWYVVIED